MRFLSGLPLKLEMLPMRRRIWRLLDELVFESSLGLVAVNVAFVTDLTSIPPWLPVFFRREGKHTPSAVVHDKVFAKGAVLGEDGEWIKVNRKQADQIMREAMQELGVSKSVERAIYYSVRIGSGRAWRRYRKNDDAT